MAVFEVERLQEAGERLALAGDVGGLAGHLEEEGRVRHLEDGGEHAGAVAALEPERVLLLPDGDEDLWNRDYQDLVALA